MNRGSSAFIGSGGHSGAALSRSSAHTRSRPGVMATAAWVRWTTSTLSTIGHSFSASSTLAFSGIFLPPRSPSSAVITNRESQSMIRPARLSAEKPPNTTECTAPMRAQASMATGVSTIMGM